MHRVTIVAIASALLVLVKAAGGQGAEGLFGHTGNNELYAVEANPVSATLIGTGDSDRAVEIEYGNGVIYATGGSTGRSNLHALDPTSGALVTTLLLTFPPMGDRVTAMEFVDGVLFAGVIDSNATQTRICIVDLATGEITPVGGPAGIGRALAGLAGDQNGNLVAATTGQDPQLYSIDPTTGLGHNPRPISFPEPIELAALEYGSDGRLFALPEPDSNAGGELLVIDPPTGLTLSLGNTGISGFRGLGSLTALTETCYPDCTQDRSLDIFDFLCFQDAFVSARAYADCTGEGSFDIFDFLCFQDAFVTGCP